MTQLQNAPAALVYFAFAPAALVLTRAVEDQPELGLIDGLGFLLSITAVAIQYFADQQLRNFRATGSYKKGISFQSGLWKYSRHPNYFCEVSMWWSIYLFSVGATGSALNWSILGVVFLTMLFLVPETGSLDCGEYLSSGKYKQYADYQKRVSKFIPWFPSKAS